MSKQYLTDCPVVGNYRTVKDSRQTNADIYPGATRFGDLMFSSSGVKKPSVRLPWRYLAENKSNGSMNTTWHKGISSVAGCNRGTGKHHGYANTHNVLHVVHHHEWSSVAPLDHDIYICSGTSVPHTKQMVSNPPGNLQCGHVLVPWVVQNHFSGFQFSSLLGVVNYRMTRASNMAVFVSANIGVILVLRWVFKAL